jgi:hypothetical protein
VLGDLGVWIVSAISRPRCSVEEAEDAETDSNAERAEVAELFPMFLKNSPRARRSRRLDRLRDLSSSLPPEEPEDAETDSNAERAEVAESLVSSFSPRDSDALAALPPAPASARTHQEPPAPETDDRSAELQSPDNSAERCRLAVVQIERRFHWQGCVALTLGWQLRCALSERARL